jgi:hypothetical protein
LRSCRPWDQPAAWGLVLADIARHLARAYEQTQGKGQSETLDAVIGLFAAELSNPTDTPTGALVS